MASSHLAIRSENKNSWFRVLVSNPAKGNTHSHARTHRSTLWSCLLQSMGRNSWLILYLYYLTISVTITVRVPVTKAKPTKIHTPFSSQKLTMHTVLGPYAFWPLLTKTKSEDWTVAVTTTHCPLTLQSPQRQRDQQQLNCRHPGGGKGEGSHRCQPTSTLTHTPHRQGKTKQDCRSPSISSYSK